MCSATGTEKLSITSGEPSAIVHHACCMPSVSAPGRPRTMASTTPSRKPATAPEINVITSSRNLLKTPWNDASGVRLYQRQMTKPLTQARP